jgi:hypothetical protein
VLLGSNRRLLKGWALAVTLADLVLACVLWAFFDDGQAGLQFVDRFAWIEPLGISYFVGLDGINLWFVLLMGFLGTVAVLVSVRFLDARPDTDARPCFVLLLLRETGVLGYSRMWIWCSSISFRSDDSHLLSDRPVGWRAERLCCAQVLSLHNGRQCADAGGHHCPGCLHYEQTGV